MKTISKIVIAVFLFVVGLSVGATQPWLAGPLAKTSNIQSNPAPTSTVSVMVDYGVGPKSGASVVVYQDVQFAQGDTVLSVLQKLSDEKSLALATKDYGSLGILVSAISGVQNAPTSDTFWQFWVNNRYSTVGAQAYSLSAGDVVMWKFVRGHVE